LSNEEITDTAWHDVEVTAPDSSGSVEIEADEAKDNISVKIKGNYIIAKFTGTGSSVTFIYSGFT
jgi:hypothetical protein